MGLYLALFIWLAAGATLVLIVVVSVVFFFKGAEAAAYLEARGDSIGWILVQGFMTMLLAVYFGLMAFRDARIALAGGPFPGIEWEYPMYTTPSGAFARAALCAGLGLVSAWRCVQAFVDAAGKLRRRSRIAPGPPRGIIGW